MRGNPVFFWKELERQGIETATRLPHLVFQPVIGRTARFGLHPGCQNEICCPARVSQRWGSIEGQAWPGPKTPLKSFLVLCNDAFLSRFIIQLHVVPPCSPRTSRSPIAPRISSNWSCQEAIRFFKRCTPQAVFKCGKDKEAVSRSIHSPLKRA